MPGKHALLSASGASRWIECPPSARLEEGFPEVTSKYAEEGTFAHALCELLIKKNLGWIKDKEFKTALAVIQADEEFYSEEMEDHCEGYAAYVIEQFNKEPGSRIYLEERLDMTDWIEEGFGTGDVVIHRPVAREILGIDFKYGKGVPVSAIKNKQGKLYLLGMLKKFDWAWDIEKATFTIFQPRLDSISSETILAEELLAWAEYILKPAAEIAYAGLGDYKPGDHCRFCKAKATCRALHDWSLAIARDAFDEEGSLKPGPLLSEKEVSEVLVKSDLFKNWVGAVEEYALHEAVKNGKKWPGFKVVEGTSRRKYADLDLVEKRLKSNLYKEEDIFEKKLLGITKMTKSIGTLDFEDLLKDLIIKPPGKPTLVPLTDKRPEINNKEKVKAMFDE